MIKQFKVRTNETLNENTLVIAKKLSEVISIVNCITQTIGLSEPQKLNVCEHCPGIQIDTFNKCNSTFGTKECNQWLYGWFCPPNKKEPSDKNV